MSEAPPSSALSRDEGLARIRLIRSAGVGPVTYGHLLRQHGSAVAALLALPDLAARGGRRGRPYAPVPEAQIAAEIRATRAAGARYIFHDSPDYPPLLRQLEDAPPVLIARGRADLMRRAPVAIVGARNASAGAIRLARDMARELAEAGYPVVSGLALGIDRAAHEGALAGRAPGRDGGATVAVIAGGIDVASPPEHAALLERIAQEGLVLTEAPPGVEPLKGHFPARNRIIAGIAAGTVVVEAAVRSGSLITARLAGEYGREVMAVPGSPLDPRSHGCNGMIREGAILIQRAEDIIELVSDFAGQPASHFRWAGAVEGPAAPALALDAPAPGMAMAQDGDAGLGARVLGLLGVAPVGVDDIIRQSGADAAQVNRALVELELTGQVLRHAGARISRAV